MGQSQSDAPATSGTAPASLTNGADITIPTSPTDTSPTVGDVSSTPNGDGISGASIGAGNPEEDLKNVQSLNIPRSEIGLGLPSIEIHDPLDETESGDGGNHATRDSMAAKFNSTADTVGGAFDGAKKPETDAIKPKADVAEKDGSFGDRSRPTNPRDASPFKNDVAADAKPKDAITEAAMAAESRVIPSSSPAITAATEAAKHAADAADRAATNGRRTENQNHHGNHRHRPGLFNRGRRHN